MIICLSFDDGREDTYLYAFPILKKTGLTASFHVTTGFVDKTYHGNDFSSLRTPVTKDNLIEMFSEGIEITSHGDRHITDASDFLNSIDKLNSWGIKKSKYGFSVPSSNYTTESLSDFIKITKSKLDYIRVGRSKKCYSFLNKIKFVMYKWLKIQMCYNSFNKHNIIFEPNKHRFCLHSLVVLNYTKASSLCRFIEKYKSSNGTLIIMLHSILPHSSSRWEWNATEFELLCNYIANTKEINCLTIEEALKKYE